MKLSLEKVTAHQSGQTLVVFIPAAKEKNKFSLPKLPSAVASLITGANDEGAFAGQRKETLFFRGANVEGFQHLLAVGVGFPRDFGPEAMRVATAVMFQSLKANKVSKATVYLDIALKLNRDSQSLVRAATEGVRLAAYEFTEHKSKKGDEKKPPRPEALVLAVSQLNKGFQSAFAEGEVLADATNFARWLGDHAANTMTPAILARTVAERAKGTKVKVTAWDKARIAKEKFGGLIAVAQGSDEEARFIIMEYRGGAKAKKPVYLVGKGLTFDTGGISIKPAAAMDEMKYDMCGAAAVIGAIFALEKLKAKVNVVALVPATENMPGPSASKPGDVMTARNGKTVEILNTDAEGRLVLADALSYASEHKPQAIFDAATLTGAIVVALGNTHTGVFTRDHKLARRIEVAASAAGEQVWAMPVTDDHVEDMKGTHADLSNISNSKGAGSATAAAFLEQFVDKDLPYAHFDIAGTAWNVANRLPYAPKKGASGVMVRTFVELIKSYF